jgi:mannitol 2-dehydrogenase
VPEAVRVTGTTPDTRIVRRLDSRSVQDLPAAVLVPEYDRSAVTPGIVHIGVGNFHRAHEALVLDRLLAAGHARDWGIRGVALLPSDESLARRMQEQDGLYTLVEKSADGSWHYRLIGSILDVLFAPDGIEAVLEAMTDPRIRIVTLTITEGGYNVDRLTGEFMPDTPAVAADLHLDAQPTSVFGVVVESLRRRRAVGIEPFTVLSCDNIQHNGDVARRMFTAFAELKDPEFAEWMRSHVSFPNSMVDRITPVTAPADIEAVSEALGVRDECPVVCEPFFQWVVEDAFPTGRPAWDLAGVQVTDDVTPYEKMKLRLLNASHQGLCYFSRLADYEYVHDAMTWPALRTFLRRFMDEEQTPTLDPVPGVDLDAYKTELIERFSNPQVRDTVARLCAESSDRIPKWLLPAVRDRLAADGDVRMSAAIVASWARYAEAVDEQGNAIEVVDPLRDELVPLAQGQRAEPTAFIDNARLFGDLATDPRFREPYLAALARLHRDGSRATVAWLVEEEDVT